MLWLCRGKVLDWSYQNTTDLVVVVMGKWLNLSLSLSLAVYGFIDRPKMTTFTSNQPAARITETEMQ